MNKRTIAILLIFMILIAISILAFKIVNARSDKTESTKKIEILPDFSFAYLSGKQFTNKDLDSSKNTLICYFSTHCPHCTYQIKDIVKNKNLFPKTEILLVSSDSIKHIESFIVNEKIDTSDIIILKADFLQISETFGDIAPPSVFLYSDSNNLLFFNKGELRTSVIASYLN